MDRLKEVFRRIRALATWARVLRIDESGPLQLFQVEGLLGEIREGVPRIGEWGLASSPPADAQAVVLAMGGDRGQLVAVGVEDRETRPVLVLGGVQLYNGPGPILRAVPGLNAGPNTVGVFGGSIDVGTTAETSVVSLEGARVTILAGSNGAALVSIGGNVAITGSAVTINGVDWSTHTHGGTTGPPQ